MGRSHDAAVRNILNPLFCSKYIAVNGSTDVQLFTETIPLIRPIGQYEMETQPAMNFGESTTELKFMIFWILSCHCLGPLRSDP